jgi:hypothetical protein
VVYRALQCPGAKFVFGANINQLGTLVKQAASFLACLVRIQHKHLQKLLMELTVQHCIIPLFVKSVT